MARLSAEEMFKNMIGRKDEEPQPAQETAAAPTAEKKKASTVQVTVRLRPEQHKQRKAAAFQKVTKLRICNFVTLHLDSVMKYRIYR